MASLHAYAYDDSLLASNMEQSKVSLPWVSNRLHKCPASRQKECKVKSPSHTDVTDQTKAFELRSEFWLQANERPMSQLVDPNIAKGVQDGPTRDGIELPTPSIMSECLEKCATGLTDRPVQPSANGHRALKIHAL
jgi:hypothetical protein